MSDVHQALSVAVEEDLLPLSALLHQHGVKHRIFEEGGRQVLLVNREDHVQQVQELYRAWRGGKVQIELSRPQRAARSGFAAAQWRRAPVTASLIVLSICGFLLVYLPAPAAWLGYVISPSRSGSDQLLLQSIDGQFWRLITPVFLHFGWLHIAFNGLWLWELGARVEQVMGHLNMFMLFLVLAIVSNVSQLAFGGIGLFGGMSGVVYGLLGFSWVAPLLQPRWPIQPSTPIMLVMVGWLLACMAGLVEVLGFGAIANAAHVGGLVCGAVLGVVFGIISRTAGDNT